MISKTFDQRGDFAAMYAAEAWCNDQGLSVGANQRGAPRGLKRGDYRVAKWRNLNERERAGLDGTMTGDMRDGPVTVTIRGSE